VIARGRDFAALDTDSHSRNTQFELRIASYFCQGGCEVDLSTDTDIVASNDDQVFYVECKRIASGRQLQKRLSEGRTQLRARLPRKDGRRRILGCIAVDITRVAFPHNGLTWAHTPEHSRDVIQDKLRSVANSIEGSLSFQSPRKLLCYWLQIHIPSLIMTPASFATRFSSYHIPRPRRGRKDERALGTFYAMFEAVSRAGDHRDIPPRSLTPRTTIVIPSGSAFRVDADRLLDLLGLSAVTESEDAEIIGRLTLNGGDHEFCFFEIRTLPIQFVQEWREALSSDPDRANVTLLAVLYSRRYPHEDSDPELR
jgi:hypothetical protein